MAISQVNTSDTILYQMNRLNDVIKAVNAGSTSGISVVETESNLPTPTSAQTNMYLVKKHSKYKGPAIAALVDSVYKFSPLKNDVINGNTFIYVESADLSIEATLNKCVYLSNTGIWNLADSTNPAKYALGIIGPYNSIILNGIITSAGLNLETGQVYYYDSTGTLTKTVTNGRAGVALNKNTLAIQFSDLTFQQQVDWNQTNTESPDYIKNKPGVVSKTADGLVPQLPNETTVTKFLRQDGIWSTPDFVKTTEGKITSYGSNPLKSQVRNIVVDDGNTTIDVSQLLEGDIYLKISNLSSI